MNDEVKNKIVFDIETQRTFDEVGGHEHNDQLGVSYVGVYSYSQNKYFGFFEDDLSKLEKILLIEKPMLIGFNSLHFDIPVLQPYLKNLDLLSLPQLDILREIEHSLGHRLKLDSVAEGTLYSRKSGSGLDAIRWYREGDLESLAKYCLDDVRITREVYEYGLRHGRLFYPTGGELKPVSISWAQDPTIPQQLSDAFKKHEQINIEYFDIDENGHKENVSHCVEILSLNDNLFEAYSHKINNKTKFLVSRVWQIEQTGTKFAHQGSLF